MSAAWRITRFRKGLALTFNDASGKRHRHALNTSDPREAQQFAPALYAELTRPQGTTVADLWKGYCIEKEGRSVVTTMRYTWKALEPHFGKRDGDTITLDDCRAYVRQRRKAGRSDGSIHTELGHLRTVVVWAEKRRLIQRAPDIDRPQKPEPKDRHLSRDEVHRILAACTLPHVRIAIHLMLATAARITAILDLTWKRVDFERRLIQLRDPEDMARRKGRATVPMNDTLLAALRVAQREAMSDYVVEWAGERCRSVKRAIGSAAARAGVLDVSPHVFRHTAAVWMAEAGVPMAEISQYLGHSNIAITIRVYARYSPTYLRGAAKALELGPVYEVPAGTPEPIAANAK